MYYILSLLLNSPGFCAAACSLTLYLLSVRSLGKRSITHWLLFTKLHLLSPTESSIKRLVSISGTQASPNNPLDRLQNLELARTTLEQGDLTLQCLKHKQATIFWKALDTSITLTCGCMLVFFYKLTEMIYQCHIDPCCAKLDCWLQRDETSSFSGSIVFLLLSFYHWKCLAVEASKIEGLRTIFLPNAYITAMLLTSTVWHLTDPKMTSIVNIPICDVVEELAARTILLLRLIGWELASNEMVLRFTRQGLAFIFGYVGFFTAEPTETLHFSICYSYYVGDTPIFLSKAKHTAFDNAHSTLVVLSNMCFVAYFVVPLLVVASFLNSTPYATQLRFTGALTFLVLVLVSVKKWQQDYLLSALPELVRSVNKPLTDEDMVKNMLNPFSIRYKTLARHGGKLMLFPILVVLVLTMAISSSSKASLGVYPIFYGGSLGDYQNLKIWYEDVARKTQLHEVCRNGTNAKLQDYTSQLKTEIPRSGSDLLEMAPRPTFTLVGKIQQMQQKMGDTIPHDARNKKVEDKLPMNDIVVTVMTHPLFTARVLYILSNLLGLVLAMYWMVTFSARAIFYRSSQRSTKDIFVQLKEAMVSEDKSE